MRSGVEEQAEVTLALGVVLACSCAWFVLSVLGLGWSMVRWMGRWVGRGRVGCWVRDVVIYRAWSKRQAEVARARWAGWL